MNWRKIKAVDYIVIHCAATRSAIDVGVKEIRSWHLKRGFFDVGYHKIIRRDGTVEDGRALDIPGAHARGFNHISWGICLVGGVGPDNRTAENNFTPEQWESLTALVTQMKQQAPDAKVLGHRDLPNVHKACPSFDAIDWWEVANEEK